MSSSSNSSQESTHTPVGLLTLAWALVGIPLVYGLVQTIRTASTLFGG